jgi:hypothetical protein
MFDPDIDLAKVDEAVTARVAEAEARYKPIKTAAVEHLRIQGAEWEKMRPTFDQLEKQDKKFNDLVMSNNRKGVRKMLETYMPWPLMEPSEKHAWRQWLDAIEKPDKKNLRLVFRGMDGYPTLKSPGSQKIGIVSSVLAMNQGNYTRRLRSLTTLRERIGRDDTSSIPEEEIKKFPKDNPSLIVQMQNHAKEPNGSPFLSVADNENASMFGSSERTAILIDDRRLVPNGMAFGYGEAERLIPLVVFPDEVVYHRPKGGGTISTEKFVKEVSKALGRPVKKTELVSGLNNEKLIKSGFDRFTTLFFDPEGKVVKTPGCVIGKPCDCVRAALSQLLNE